MVIKQYPHSIKISEYSEPFIDGDGNPQDSALNVVFSGACRAEVNGTGDLVRGDDGSELNYAFNVYLPKMVIDIASNSQVEIVIDNKIVKGIVKRHSNGMLNSRLWV